MKNLSFSDKLKGSLLRIALIISIIAGISACDPISHILPKGLEGMTVPLPLEVYPTSDTLYVGDTLWIKANFSSQIQTEDGKTIDANGTEIDIWLFFPKMDDPTHNVFMNSKISLAIPICKDGFCNALMYVVMTRTGIFYIESGKLDDLGPGGGAFHKYENGKITETIRYGVQYKLLPDKGTWYDKLRTEYDNPRKDRSIYPFVVIE
jgi:hypothetical protein